MTPAAHIDPEQIAEICRLAIVALPHASRAAAQALHCAADGDSISIVLASVRGRRAAERALRQHGYHLAATGDRDTLRVTGLDPDTLATRITALGRAVSGLERRLPHTIVTAAHTYARLYCHVEPAIALYGTADALRADIEGDLTRQIGPLPRRRPGPRGLPDLEREQLAAVNELTQRAIDLLAQHWHAAIRAAERVAELSHRHPFPAAETQAIAEIRLDMARQRRRALFLDACQWAVHHIARTDVPRFADWYVAEHGPPRWQAVPIADARRRWAALDHERPDSNHGSPSGDPCCSRTLEDSR